MSRVIAAFTQFFDDSGDPLINGWLRFLESGTNNTDKDTYADVDETIANQNPLPLDGAGRCPNVFGPGVYRVISYMDDPLTPGQPGQQMQPFDPVGEDNLTLQDWSSWNSEAVYSITDIVKGSDQNYYRSLSNNNQGNDPTLDASNWERIDFNYYYNGNKEYTENDVVIDIPTGLRYRSKVSNNLGNPPQTSPTEWEQIGTILYRDFDLNGNSIIYNTSGNAVTPVELGLLDGKSEFDFKTIGEIITWALETPPSGYKICNGDLLSRETYSELFALLGENYGAGDGSTTFKLPDYRGYALRGTDDGAGIDPDAASRTDRGDGTTGDNVGTKQGYQLESHAHTDTGYANLNVGGNPRAADTTGTASGITSDSYGGSETRMVNINVNWCIFTGVA